MNSADDAKSGETKAELNQLGLSQPKVFQDYTVMQAGKLLHVFGTSKLFVDVSVTLDGNDDVFFAECKDQAKSIYGKQSE